MNLFDILGPVMVGPSSSHTAGAVRIGYISGKLLQDHVVKAEILLHGSFATTGIGHGTDKALIAGLLGMHPDDIRIPDSFALAKKAGMEFTFSTVTLKDAHPNTAVLRLTGEHGRKIEVQASSIGGLLVHSARRHPCFHDTHGCHIQETSLSSSQDENISTHSWSSTKGPGGIRYH